MRKFGNLSLGGTHPQFRLSTRQSALLYFFVPYLKYEILSRAGVILKNLWLGALIVPLYFLLKTCFSEIFSSAIIEYILY